MNLEQNNNALAILQWLRDAESQPWHRELLAKFSELVPEDFEQSLRIVDANWDSPRPFAPARLALLLQQAVASVLHSRQVCSDQEFIEPLIEPDLLTRLVEKCNAIVVGKSPDSLKDYSQKTPVTGRTIVSSAAHCLQILAAQGDQLSLERLAEHLGEAPPAQWQSVALAVSPLFQHPPENLSRFFEQLGNRALQASTAGPLLDLANFCFRRSHLGQHPFAEQIQSLTKLLGGLVGRLAKMEDNPYAFGDDVDEVQSMLADSISLIVSLCDALGLIGDTTAVPKLSQALALSHRRIQAEAAGALARLGIESGKGRLIELVSEPVARLRAIAYAEELGFEDELPEEFREPVALAEADMASWLSESDHFGFPPNELQLVDERIQYWPSFEEPQACFLWRFTYHLPTTSFSNIGISGPMTHAFRANLADMSIDDIYSVFAGWLVQHDDIYEVATDAFNASQRADVGRLERLLSEKDVEQIETLALTFFFGERAILSIGTRGGARICAVTDSLETILFPIGRNAASLTPDLVLALYRGRKMLRTFNPSREE